MMEEAPGALIEPELARDNWLTPRLMSVDELLSKFIVPRISMGESDANVMSGLVPVMFRTTWFVPVVAITTLVGGVPNSKLGMVIVLGLDNVDGLISVTCPDPFKPIPWAVPELSRLT